jgi:hypothetical protein
MEISLTTGSRVGSLAHVQLSVSLSLAPLPFLSSISGRGLQPCEGRTRTTSSDHIARGGHWRTPTACGATATMAQTGWPVELDGMRIKASWWRFGEGA